MLSRHVLLPLLLAAGCKPVSPGGEPDGGGTDGSVNDSGAADGGVLEAGAHDGSASDAGATDAPGEASVDAATACEAGAVMCSGACADTSSDPTNCGSCGHDCLGGGCNAGQCQAVVLDTGHGAGSSIALDATYVYWTTATLPGRVYRVAKAGGGMSTLAVFSGQVPSALAVQGQTVYFASGISGGSTIYSIPVTGVPLDGGAPQPTMLYGDSNVSSVAVDPGNIYWNWSNGSTMGGINQAPIAGGGTVIPLATGEPYARTVRVDSTTVYWCNGATSGAVESTIIGGGPIASLAPTFDSNGLALDSANVYFTNVGSDSTEVNSVPLDGGAVTKLAANQDAWGLAVDSQFVYWTNNDGVAPVNAVPIDGGSVLTLATGQAQPLASRRTRWPSTGPIRGTPAP